MFKLISQYGCSNLIQHRIMSLLSASGASFSTQQDFVRKYLDDNKIRVFEGRRLIVPGDDEIFFDWEKSNLDPQLLNIVQQNDLKTPFPIQSISIPQIQKGRSMISVAETGSGKTLAFGLPALQFTSSKVQQERLKKVEKQVDFRAKLSTPSKIHSLIVTPTRELAQQVYDSIAKFNYQGRERVRMLAVYGGVQRSFQIQRLQDRTSMVIGTPGRINDLINSSQLDVSNCQYLVLDEADRMLDMGFKPQITEIVEKLPQERQSLLFTATMDKTVKEVAKFLFKEEDLLQVEIGDRNLTVNENISQNFCLATSDHDKFNKFIDYLQEISKEQNSKTLVFCERINSCNALLNKIKDLNLECTKDTFALHSQLQQRQRTDILKRFRSQQNGILIATDVAQRGLDISDINYVINYDFPRELEGYIHRIGRTGRAGNQGRSFSLITRDDLKIFQNLGYLLKKNGHPIPKSYDQVYYELRQ